LWLVVCGIVVIGGFALSEFTWKFDLVTFQLSSVGAYFGSVEHWNGEDWTGIPNSRDVFRLLSESALAISWSWASGLTLGALSGRKTWLSGLLFYLMVVNSYPIACGSFRPGSPHAPPLSTLLIDRLLPVGLTQALLFLLPAVCGMRTGSRTALSRRERAC
jgi:hypothetical protein